MEALPPGIFSPLAPGHSVATLVLIENSEEMMSRWPDLRDRYLPNLLGTMRRANPHVPIQILWMTSCPAPSEDQLSPSFNRSRQYNQLPELRPIAHPKNRISLGTLYRALELLSSTFQDVPTTRHLIVVSASTPIDDLDDMVGIPSTPDSHSAWDYLSSVVCQKSIYLHMILTPAPGHDMDKFVRLHADTSRIQGCCNANPWFQADLDKYSFFLSCPVNPVPAMQQGQYMLDATLK
ncbi:hypothetical protein EWM64_g8547 [Hericium alpestre]|uniref:Mediator of RNA polymerase II transcription subunit 25 n=1 Tax=Hericium alpestre TaxID=135208 RepID=A0A4Y9ZMH6_9AGAM|nr:hypothetical protein EWM64_g8547 [Hericium alpestre]